MTNALLAYVRFENSKLALFLLTMLSGALYAQLPEIKLVPSDALQGDLFGRSVSVSGERLLIGASRGSGIDTLSGAAYVFRREGETWTEEAKLIASDGADGDNFGHSVSVFGDFALIGAKDHAGNEIRAGAAYVFRREGETWTEEAKLIASDGDAHDSFGSSVAVFEDCALIGSPEDQDNGDFSGSAYIFRREGDTWIQEAKLLASDGKLYDRFGSSVAISGDYAIIGAPTNNENVGAVGAVYVYRYMENAWEEQTRLMASDAMKGAGFGYSVSLNSEYALIGATGGFGFGDDPGSAYAFRRDGEVWIEEDKLLATDGADDDWFGYSVSGFGDYALIGAALDYAPGYRAGSAYIFRRDGESWVQDTRILPGDRFPNRTFGSAVDITGEHAIVGAPFAEQYGAVYVYSGFFREVLLDLEIDSLYHFIPMEGDTFPVYITLTNATGDIQNVEYWTQVFTPDGFPLGTVFGPHTIGLQPFDTVGIQQIVECPAEAETGEYEVISYAGFFPDDIIHSDNAAFIKLGFVPQVSGPIPDQFVIEDFETYMVADLDTVFSHPGGLPLTYSAVTDGNTVAPVPGGLLYLASIPGFNGTSQVIVTASDEQPASVSDTFYVYVEPALAVNGDPVSPPKAYRLFQNYPNPFNPVTTVLFTMPNEAHVSLKIYNVNGEQVRELMSEFKHAGKYSVTFDASSLAAGTYFYTLTSGNFNDTKKFTLVK